MTRRAVLAALVARAAAQDRDPRIAAAHRRLLDASRALQAGNGPLFLSFFDRKRVGEFRLLREWINALTAQRDVASSIDLVGEEIEGSLVRFRVDWVLQLSSSSQLGAIESRREVVELAIDGKRIIEIGSIDLFRP